MNYEPQIHSGKKKKMENHHFSWVNQLFLWPCSIAFCMFTRGYTSPSPQKPTVADSSENGQLILDALVAPLFIPDLPKSAKMNPQILWCLEFTTEEASDSGRLPLNRTTMLTVNPVVSQWYPGLVSHFWSKLNHATQWRRHTEPPRPGGCSPWAPKSTTYSPPKCLPPKKTPNPKGKHLTTSLWDPWKLFVDMWSLPWPMETDMVLNKKKALPLTTPVSGRRRRSKRWWRCKWKCEHRWTPVQGPWGLRDSPSPQQDHQTKSKSPQIWSQEKLMDSLSS